jgi:hypothetical protein
MPSYVGGGTVDRLGQRTSRVVEARHATCVGLEDMVLH